MSHEIRLTLAGTFAALGDYQRAQELATSALNLAARLGTNEPGGRAHALHMLSQAQWGLGADDQAEQTEREALKTAEKTWGITNEFTAEVMTALADMLFDRVVSDDYGAHVLKIRARAAEYLNLYTAALESRRAIFGDQHIAYAESLAKMAKTSFYVAKYDEAERMLLKALSIQTNVLGADCLTLTPPAVSKLPAKHALITEGSIWVSGLGRGKALRAGAG